MITTKGIDTNIQRVCSVRKGAPVNMIVNGIAASTIHHSSLSRGLVLPEASGFLVVVAESENAAESSDVAKNPRTRTRKKIGTRIPPGSRSRIS